MVVTIANIFLPPILVVRVLSPTFVFLAAVSLLFVHPQQSSSSSPITTVVVASRVPRRAAILSLLSLSALTFLLDGLSFVLYAVLDRVWLHNTGIEFSSTIGLFAFAGLAALGSWKDIHGVNVWLMKRIKFAVVTTLAFDIAAVALIYIKIQDRTAPPGTFHTLPVRILLQLALPAFRILLLVLLLVVLSTPRVVYTPISTVDEAEESALTSSSFLLPPGGPSSTGISPVAGISSDASKYGTFRTTRSNLQRSVPATRAATPAPSTAPDLKSESKPEIALDPSWSEVLRRIRRLSPYLWPSKSRYLQLLAVFCIAILLIGRFINVAIPYTLGELIRILEGKSPRSPWPVLFGYVGLRYLQGSGGLAALRDSLWAPVMQYSDREMSQMSFDHLLNLSFAWHTRRKTGEILRVLDRGAAINHTFELVLFNIVPTFIDIAVALIVFCILFEWTLALVIFFVMFAYVYASVILTQWRTKLRRQMNDRDIITRGIHTDCLLNYETVKYFGGEEHEGARYKEAVSKYQALEYKVILSLNMLNMVQNLIITFGLLVGALIVAHRITEGKSDAGDFVVFITYLAQLYGPLNQLGYTYRSVNQSLVDTEKLLALLNEPTDVNDKLDAPELVVNDGEIEFDNVSFSYDGRSTALNGVSFKVPKGSSVALVGESGSGKSTILRLLYRFYDLREGEGRILIDGQDIRDVTQKSLRQSIGVVPQDSVLFNTSIRYNIGYGKFDASEEEIVVAAKSAQMHERIMSFPDGYGTKVGERGVRLSGGEKQRVAIARTLLKNPPILLLDEATSALDTSTEKDIQKALQNLVKGRSSLSIAHRLSTIASADIILVLKDGQIVEQGSHKELLTIDGLFASMWADQVSATEDPVGSIGGISTKKEQSSENVEPFQIEDKPAGSSVMTPDPEDPENVHKSINLDNTEVDHSKPSNASVTHDFPTSENEARDSTDVTPEQQVDTLAFPASDTPDAERSGTPVISPPTSVTFGADVNSSPRTGTPDPANEPKRKRISSQNFKRLARRISITTRRQSSSPSIIPSFKRDNSPRISADDGTRGESSSNSPAPSLKVDDKVKLKKKDKESSKKGTV